MNQIVQWNPFHALLDPLAEFRSPNGDSAPAAEWTPSVDIFETDDVYIFVAELPGVRKEDVNVQVENGVLVLSGQRKLENEQKIRMYHRLESAYGRFTRSFELPEGVDGNSIKASFHNGVLTINVAKAESAKPRKIEVKVA
jgi:HSP20 family protein